MNRAQQSAKEYLSQVYHIDQRINSKLEQVCSMRELAAKATCTITDMPRASSPIKHQMEAVIVKMLDLETEINEDIDALVDLKREIMTVIKSVQRPEHQTVLEMRYLCFKTWQEIADTMHYCVQNVYYLHDNALKTVAALRNL